MLTLVSFFFLNKNKKRSLGAVFFEIIYNKQLAKTQMEIKDKSSDFYVIPPPNEDIKLENIIQRYF